MFHNVARLILQKLQQSHHTFIGCILSHDMTVKRGIKNHTMSLVGVGWSHQNNVMNKDSMVLMMPTPGSGCHDQI